MKKITGKVIAIGSQLVYFVGPIQVTIESHNKGYAIAIAARDMQSALVNSMYYTGITFYTSTLLIICKKHFSWTIRLMEQHDHSNLWVHTNPNRENPPTLDGHK